MSLIKRIARTTLPFRRALAAAIAAPPAPRAPTAAPPQQYFSLSPDLGVVRLKYGPFLYVDPLDEYISANVIVHGCWEPGVHDVVMALLAPGARVVEVGANIGYYTLTMAHRVGAGGHVIALEANPRMVGLVERSVRLNGLQDRVRLIGQAAMDTPGRISFTTSRTNAGGGFVTIWDDHKPYDDGVQITVDAVRLDDLDCGHVDMIRMDAEGTEPFILRGAAGILAAHPDIVIVMEWALVQMESRTSVPEFVGWLAGMGFRFWRIRDDFSLTEVSAEAMLTLEPCDVACARRPISLDPAYTPLVCA